MRSSDVVTRGLEQPRERAFLLGCALLLLAYAGALLWFRANGDPVDRQFLRRREAFLMERLAAHPLRPGVRIGPGPGGRPAPEIALLDGWSGIEPTGAVWSDGPLARLGLVLPTDGRDGAVLEIAAIANLGPSGRQGVAASVNGRPVAEWTIREPAAVLRLDVPAAAIPATGVLVLTLAIADPRSPSPDDRRRLGIALEGIALLPRGN